MKFRSIRFGFILGLSAAASASAFETQTHAYITYNAYQLSKLADVNDPSLIIRLGLDRLSNDQPFIPYWLALTPLSKSTYYDNTPGADPSMVQRFVTANEWAQMHQLALAGWLGNDPSKVLGSTPIQTLPLINWLIRGVIREDDILQSDYRSEDPPTPDVDPYGEFRRVFNHFYDPVNDRMLHASRYGSPDINCSSFASGYPFYAGGYCGRSVDWALGTVNAFQSLAADPNHHNHFSWADARQNYFLALTAERDPNSDGKRNSSERAADTHERLIRWATTFRSLGDVIHLLQDMAQPQHSRNDPHDPHATGPDERQAFEPFTNARLIDPRIQSPLPANPTGGETYLHSLNGLGLGAFIKPLPTGAANYAKPSFATPLRFFTTRASNDPPGTIPDGRYGLGDYSNRGFFTRGTLPGVTTLPRPITPVSVANGYTATEAPCEELPALRERATKCVTYKRTVPDPLQPNRADVTTPQPIVSEGMWKGLFGSNKEFTLSPAIFQAQGDLTVPRAIAYSAGLIDYFFRGQLEVSAPSDRVVGVLNQGATHTMNAAGYPCVGTSTVDGCPIFGFEKIRVKVRNTTLAIVESGTNATIPQSTGGAGAKLVAVARYHRNSCYKPDLSGERAQSYAPPPQLIITEPTCAAGQTARTAYQEIAVSAPLSVASGELDNLGDGVDKFFDFSSDPIPVNATDVFLQVVYRGALGQEPDSIALGTFDVREPTVAAFWNNTDQWWNGSSWFAYSPTYPTQSAKDFWVCSGGAPVKLVFQYMGATGTAALTSPVSNQNTAGIVRLGFLFPPPDPGLPTQRKSIRGVSVNYATPGYPQIPQRSAYTSGSFHQANKEQMVPATLAAPTLNCGTALPSAEEYWCSDPIQKRRNQFMGSPAQPLYLEPVGGGSIPTDVDAVPLAAFAGVTALSSGTLRFNTDATLAACPAQPAALLPGAEVDSESWLEVIEEARAWGVSGE